MERIISNQNLSNTLLPSSHFSLMIPLTNYSASCFQLPFFSLCLPTKDSCLPYNRIFFHLFLAGDRHVTSGFPCVALLQKVIVDICAGESGRPCIRGARALCFTVFLSLSLSSEYARTIERRWEKRPKMTEGGTTRVYCGGWDHKRYRQRVSGSERDADTMRIWGRYYSYWREARATVDSAIASSELKINCKLLSCCLLFHSKNISHFFSDF